MKRLFESWRRYATSTEANEPEDPSEMTLYHVSSVPDIEVLDPAIAAKNVRNYTQREYRTWDRPRVFYFTKWGQKDIGIGRIMGNPYRVKIRSSELYSVMDDPLKLSHPEREEEYKDIRLTEKGIPEYYPINRFEMVATLGEREHGFKGFIYPQGENRDNEIVVLWEPAPAEKVDKTFYTNRKGEE